MKDNKKGSQKSPSEATFNRQKEAARRRRRDAEWSATTARLGLFALCFLQGPIITIKVDDAFMRPLSALGVMVIGLPPQLVKDYESIAVALLLPGQIFQHAFAAVGYCAMAAVQDSSKAACESAASSIISDSEKAVALMIGSEVTAQWSKAVEGEFPVLGLSKHNVLMGLTGLVAIGSLSSLFSTWLILSFLVPVLMFAVLCSYPTVVIMPGLMLCGLLAIMTVPPGALRKALSRGPPGAGA